MLVLSKWLEAALTYAKQTLGEPLFYWLFLFCAVGCIIWWKYSKAVANKRSVIKNSKLEYTNMDNSRRVEVSGENHGGVVIGDNNTFIHGNGDKKDANGVTEEIADKYISKIHELARLVTNGDALNKEFACLVHGFKEADQAPSYAKAKEMILEGTWASGYGTIAQILNDVFSKLFAYKSVGVIFYVKSEDSAKAKGVSPSEVQNKIWDELSEMERMLILLYGAREKKYTLEYKPGEAHGRGFDFYELIGSTPWSKHFDVARLVYSVFAGYMGKLYTLPEILEDEHKRCMQEMKAKGRA